MWQLVSYQGRSSLLDKCDEIFIDHLVVQVIDYPQKCLTAGYCHIISWILFLFTSCHLLIS